jgi:AcrR family transcriptional regulator
MPRAFSEHEKEVINQRLLEQGARLFSTYGLRKTNVDEIARAAGISKGAFYNFYASKEALFMDVIEQDEEQARKELLAVIDLPGPTPRARLYAVMKKAFELFRTMPILQLTSGSDYDLIFRSIPPEKLQEHLTSDQAFFDEMVNRCQAAGIPIQVQPEQLGRLVYPLVLAMLHEDDFGLENFSGGVEALLELVTAFCLGEVKLEQEI